VVTHTVFPSCKTVALWKKRDWELIKISVIMHMPKRFELKLQPEL